MSKFLLACVLTLGVGMRAAAYTDHPAQAKAVRGAKKSSTTLVRSAKGVARKTQVGSTLQVAEVGSLRQVSSQLQEPSGMLATAQRLVEEQLLAQADSAVAMTIQEFRVANPETADLPAELAIALRRPAAPLGRRRFSTRLVRTGRWSTRREAVESLTCTDAGPLVLARLPATATTPAQLLAGPGYDKSVALRPLELTQEAVLHLCGARTAQVRAYAMLYNLRFEQVDDVARLLDYYNRLAVVAE